MGKKEMIEKLASLEHEQWMKWSMDLVNKENISNDRVDRWMKFWVPYAKLEDDVKEHDRVWARKVLKIVHSGVQSTKNQKISGKVAELKKDIEGYIERRSEVHTTYTNGIKTGLRVALDLINFKFWEGGE